MKGAGGGFSTRSATPGRRRRKCVDVRKDDTSKRALPLMLVAAIGALSATITVSHETKPVRGCWLKVQPQALSLRKVRCSLAWFRYRTGYHSEPVAQQV